MMWLNVVYYPFSLLCLHCAVGELIPPKNFWADESKLCVCAAVFLFDHWAH